MSITINKTVYTKDDVVFYRHTDGSIRKAEVQEYAIIDGTVRYTIGGGYYAEADVSAEFEDLRAAKEAEISDEITKKQDELVSAKSITADDIVDETKEVVD